MTVAILIISHHSIGEALLSAVKKMVDHIPLRIEQIEIAFDMPLDNAFDAVHEKIDQINQGEGVLILTDLFGATPCNVASRFQANDIQVVSGVNLPMLLKLVTNPRLPLEEMVERAIDGGQIGIIRCQDYLHA